MDFQVAAELADFPTVIRWPVQWGDQDAFGHVNNTIYFRWFESARLAYAADLGLPQMVDGEVVVGPILRTSAATSAGRSSSPITCRSPPASPGWATRASR